MLSGKIYKLKDDLLSFSVVDESDPNKECFVSLCINGVPLLEVSTKNERNKCDVINVRLPKNLVVTDATLAYLRDLTSGATIPETATTLKDLGGFDRSETVSEPAKEAIDLLPFNPSELTIIDAIEKAEIKREVAEHEAG